MLYALSKLILRAGHFSNQKLTFLKLFIPEYRLKLSLLKSVEFLIHIHRNRHLLGAMVILESTFDSCMSVRPVEFFIAVIDSMRKPVGFLFAFDNWLDGFFWKFSRLSPTAGAYFDHWKRKITHPFSAVLKVLNCKLARHNAKKHVFPYFQNTNWKKVNMFRTANRLWNNMIYLRKAALLFFI